MPRGRGQSSLAKNQLDLAIALSSSLEESKTRELSKLAEELPADAIEDGAVPQRIKQMQKEFLERLQPKTAAGPARRTKKVLNTAVPTLLTRSCDERLRIITEKVALVLIKDEFDYNYPTVLSQKEAIQDNYDKENVLWQKSGIYISEADRHSYYIDSLAAYISPTVSKNNCQSISVVQLPETLISPVICKPSENSIIEQKVGKELDISLQHCFNIQQFAPDCKIQEAETRTELQDDWQRMVNNSAMSDVSIVTKEKRKISAHKLIFSVRCPAILNDLSGGSELQWNTVTYKEAIAFIEFVYSGRLDATRALQPHADGVALLARKYKVTELLKLILAYDSNIIENSSTCDATNVSGINPPEEDVLIGNISSDMFAEVDDTEMPVSVPQEPINVDSDNDDLLVRDFFGTYNPIVSSPILSSSFPSTVPSARTLSPWPAMSLSLQLTENKENSSVVRKTLIFDPPPLNSISQGRNPDVSYNSNDSKDTELHLDKSTPEIPLKQHSQSGSLSNMPNSPVNLSNVNWDENTLISGSQYTKRVSDMTETPYKDPIEISSEENSPPLSQSSPRKRDSSSATFMLGASQRTNYHCLSGVTSEDVEVIDVELDSPVVSKRKLWDSGEEEVNDSCTAKKVCIESPCITLPQKMVESIEISSGEGSSSPAQVGVASSSQLFQRDEDLFEDSFNLNVSWSQLNENIDPTCAMSLNQSTDDCREQTLETPKAPRITCAMSLNQSTDGCREQTLETPKAPRTTSLIKESNNSTKKLLDDSFVLDVNDSYLLRGAEIVQTPEQRPTMIFDTPLRTPLEDVKTSSPATPMPDYSTMSNEQFETELLRFGLKRGLSRNKGIKLLTHIYGKTHPLVEVVNLRGKELFIPIGEKSPVRASTVVPRLPPSPQQPVLLEEKERPDEEPYTQQSCSSDEDDCVVQEETMFLNEEHCSPEAFSDLKTGVHKWIASKPELHERILRYEPIWLESIHAELKEYLQVNVKVNQLMDVLDEEGITFRVAQPVGRNTRRKKSPKKKASQASKR